MLIKIKENLFVNLLNVHFIKGVYDQNAIVMSLYVQVGEKTYVKITRNEIDCEILIAQCLKTGFIRFGKALVNPNHISYIKVIESVKVEIGFSNSTRVTWTFPSIDEKDIKELFRKFNIDSVGNDNT